MKPLKNSALFLICFLFFKSLLLSQALVPITSAEVLKDYETVLEYKVPGIFNRVEVIDVYKLDDNYSVIVFEDDGIKFEELVLKREEELMIIATHKKVDRSKIPSLILDAFKKEGDDKPVTSYYTVQYHFDNGAINYCIETSTEGKTNKYYYNKFGHSLEAPK